MASFSFLFLVLASLRNWTEQTIRDVTLLLRCCRDKLNEQLPSFSRLVKQRLRLGKSACRNKQRYCLCVNEECGGIFLRKDIEDAAAGSQLPVACDKCGTPLTHRKRGRQAPVLPLTCVPLRSYLERLFAIPGFTLALDAFATTVPADRTRINDFVDGNIYKEQMRPFLEQNKHAILLQICVDSFLPHVRAKRRGACTNFYIRVMNIDVHHRCSPHLAHLWCAAPGSDSSSLVEPLLQVLVEELQDLESNGVQVELPDGSSRVVKAKLHSVVGDQIALKAICSTVGPNGARPCMMCEFDVGDHKNKDFSKPKGQPRTRESVLADAARWQAASKQDRHDVQRDTGIKGHSALFSLRGFTYAQIFCVDALHQIGLSLVTRTMQNLLARILDNDSLGWREVHRRREQLLADSEFLDAQLPADLKAGLTAKELNKEFSRLAFGSVTFAAIHALPLLSPHLADTPDAIKMLEDLREICLFCLCHGFTAADIDRVNAAVDRYRRLYEQLFGREEMVVAHHLILHLTESVMQLGPGKQYSTWFFER